MDCASGFPIIPTIFCGGMRFRMICLLIWLLVGEYLKVVLAVTAEDDFLLSDPKDFVLIDEVGSMGSDFPK